MLKQNERTLYSRVNVLSLPCLRDGVDNRPLSIVLQITDDREQNAVRRYLFLAAIRYQFALWKTTPKPDVQPLHHLEAAWTPTTSKDASTSCMTESTVTASPRSRDAAVNVQGKRKNRYDALRPASASAVAAAGASEERLSAARNDRE